MTKAQRYQVWMADHSHMLDELPARRASEIYFGLVNHIDPDCKFKIQSDDVILLRFSDGSEATLLPQSIH